MHFARTFQYSHMHSMWIKGRPRGSEGPSQTGPRTLAVDDACDVLGHRKPLFKSSTSCMHTFEFLDLTVKTTITGRAQSPGCGQPVRTPPSSVGSHSHVKPRADARSTTVHVHDTCKGKVTPESPHCVSSRGARQTRARAAQTGWGRT